jgi:hypothetical protein
VRVGIVHGVNLRSGDGEREQIRSSAHVTLSLAMRQKTSKRNGGASRTLNGGDLVKITGAATFSPMEKADENRVILSCRPS